MGGFEEYAYRAQLLIEPSDDFSALLNIHGRDIDGTASIFRANVLGPGSYGFNSNYDRDSVFYDGGDGNLQSAEGLGGSLRLDFGLGGDVSLTSITAYENTESSSRGDIDGGFGADFLNFLPPPYVGPCPPGSAVGDPCIPFPSDTLDGIDNLDQFTQEIRFSSQASDRLFWQAGAYYFDSEFSVTTNPFFTPAATTMVHENTAWAVFGHLSYDVTDAFTLTGGLRYTDDDKDLSGSGPTGASIAPVSVADEQVSWDLSALFEVNEDFNIYARLANGFRAPTIQGRDVAFGGAPSIADSETINSIEFGFKSQLADDRIRLNAAVFYYEVDDLQLSAIGGGGNFVQLVNADKGTGMGLDLDGEFLFTDRFMMTLGFSYTDTEIDDSTLVVPPCGSGLCTVLDPLDVNGNAIIDGNSFTQAPEYVATVTARYGIPIGTNGELFFFTDWAFQGETQFFIYESEEFKSDGNFEGGARIGYSHDGGKWEVALFGRNITDEENVKGAIDFNNLTGFDNEPRIVGVSFRARF
jgi:iron complex outermembrane receptor protein